MSKAKKYREGATFRSLGELIDWLELGRWVYCRHKVYHPGFISNWGIRTVTGGIREGAFRRAVEQ